MNIKLVVCVDKCGGISKNGEIPWEIKEDTNFFVDQINNPICKKKLIVVGRNTYPKVMNLKDCHFLIVSTTFVQNTDSDKNNIKIINNINHLKNNLYENYSDYDIFVLGGKKIYEYVINTFYNVDYIVSKINHDYSCDNIINNFNMIFEISIDYLPSKTFNLKDTKNNIDVDVTFYSKHFNNSKNKNNKTKDEQAYLDLLEYILLNGDRRNTRNGYTYSMFGKTLEFNLDRFPLLTTKKMFLKGIFEELMFFIKGDTNSNKLKDIGVKIWEGNTTREFLDKNGFTNRKEGDMGPMYGFQWRHFNAKYTDCDADYKDTGFDQLAYCINLLKTDPTSRRIIMTTYNPAQAFEGVLFPCHGITIMFYCIPAGDNTFRLDLMMTQRSCDLFLGVPFNISSYALFVYLICDHINNSDSKYKYIPGRLIMNLGDVHIYEDHKTQAIRQILRTPLEFPNLEINKKILDLESYKFDDIVISDYKSYTGIIAKMVA
jgi:thymidylate synthase